MQARQASRYFFYAKTIAMSVNFRTRLQVIEFGLMRMFILVALILSSMAIVLIPRGSIQSSAGVGALLLIGLALAICCVALASLVAMNIQRGVVLARLSRISLGKLIAGGALLQIGAAFIFHPVQLSDSAVYLRLAHQLSQGKPYQDTAGFLAFWPPGLPLYLTPFVRVIRSDFYALLLANLLLYCLAARSIYSLARTLFDKHVAIVSTMLFVIWPSRILLTTLASKETLTLTTVVMSLAIAVRIHTARSRISNDCFALALGFLLGLSALAQPGLTLLFCLFPVGLWFLWKRFTLSALLRLFAFVAVMFLMTIAPWIVRNYTVFDGQFIGIATNGGSVFYRANNDESGAEYSSRGTIDLSGLSELEQNAEGFRLGKQWLFEHPIQEMRLASKKLAALLDNDSQGVYWAVQRGGGEIHKAEDAQASRAIIGDVLNLVSYWYWMMLCAAVSLVCMRTLRDDSPMTYPVALLVMPLIYCAVVFSIFESGARQHIFAGPALIIVAALNVRQPRDEFFQSSWISRKLAIS